MTQATEIIGLAKLACRLLLFSAMMKFANPHIALLTTDLANTAETELRQGGTYANVLRYATLVAKDRGLSHQDAVKASVLAWLHAW